MKVLFCHPSGLMYTEIFLRLEPLGVELCAEAARQAGHQVRVLDLQAASQDDYRRTIDTWRPDAICFGLNYLANIPEVVDLARETRRRLPHVLFVVGGHSASFTAKEILEHAGGAIDCVVRGEGEEITPRLLDAAQHDRSALHTLPGVVTVDGEGPPPEQVQDLNRLMPARDLLPRRRKYFIGVLDPAASIEFSRGCPWDCSFCSAWTFYGRSYRLVSPERVLEDLRTIREPGIFIVDDVAFIHENHGMELGEAVAHAGIRKKYYLETRGDVLLRNKEVFRFWKRLGVEYIFLGLEAIDEEGLLKYRKRVPLGRSFEALEFARSLGIQLAINLIADPDWDRERFRIVREWCLEQPEIINISVNTPYPGTESWVTEERRLQTRDYRLYDIQHAVLPTRLPLVEFYEELVATQRAIYAKFLGWTQLRKMAGISAGLLLRGRTNYIKGLFKMNSVFRPDLLIADHAQPVDYEIPLPPPSTAAPAVGRALYVHAPRGRAGRAIDAASERFVDETRMGTAP
jgi:hopanoid C-3 methylase HpnR